MMHRWHATVLIWIDATKNTADVESEYLSHIEACDQRIVGIPAMFALQFSQNEFGLIVIMNPDVYVGVSIVCLAWRHADYIKVQNE